MLCNYHVCMVQETFTSSKGNPGYTPETRAAVWSVRVPRAGGQSLSPEARGSRSAPWGALSRAYSGIHRVLVVGLGLHTTSCFPLHRPAPKSKPGADCFREGMILPGSAEALAPTGQPASSQNAALFSSVPLR